MKEPLKVIFDTIKVTVLFTICTAAFYFGLKWLDHNYESYHKYDEPSGRAVKVYEPIDSNKKMDWSGRLIEFFRNGE
ncbi:dihydrodipicolinate reductase [Scopulibacillus daqui]|uniref:Dihydrodipicolinate reductase n=1 Tax=Scopulibacillus daqui TaxID=1469162 RepID=A0ABS2Q202_9BACL|nr:YqzK family protein [Scopulibacillus daqui]MBM7646226.1 dihydrodipicolinate reductase [Scopulibacillus daqui]